ncbi:MAG: glycosyltransferase [Planctomycetes bacterium]|nr:glycosyltransferase [Planctomycetota bacterium]
MIQGRLIVCIASAWDYDPTSKHHIMRILSRHNDVLWINYHGTRRPFFGRPASPGAPGSVSRLYRTDLRDSIAVLRRIAGGMQRVAPSIVQLTPMVIPGARSALLRRLHQWLLISSIRRAVKSLTREQKRPIQLWTFAPDVPYLVGAFGEERSVYCCVDEYREFEGIDTERVTAAEQELIQRADVVVTTSEGLYKSRSRERPDTVLVRHGVDFDHFASAWRDPPPAPADIADIPKPIFGYFGLIHHWVDRALLAETARLRPQYSFVLLGDCKVDMSELAALPNVYLLGRRPYESLPAYAAQFDAGLLLFARNEMTRHVNPVKMYEYLAAGLPVVSTPLPEAQRFAGPIVFAHGAEKFADACDFVLQGNGRNRTAISECVREETWSATVDRLCEVVMTSGPDPLVTTPQSKPTPARRGLPGVTLSPTTDAAPAPLTSQVA